MSGNVQVVIQLNANSGATCNNSANYNINCWRLFIERGQFIG